MKFEYYVNYGCKRGEAWKSDYRWRLRARNGKIIASGEGYTTKRACLKAIELVKSSVTAEVKEI